jgi:tetraacyldisaccharide 4'-kinase
VNARVAAGTALLRGLGRTWRVEFAGQAHLDAARAQSPRGNVIYAFWHGSLLILAYTHRSCAIQVLVSQHRDGEWIASILARLGYGLVRGSTRRGGVEALFQLATRLDDGLDVAVTVDGPLGPRYGVHPGVALLARRTGRPIVPVVPTSSRGWTLGTWDALRVPAPGARVRVAFEPAIWVPADAAAQRVAPVQAELATRLGAATERDEARWGRRIVLADIQDRRSAWERWSERAAPPAALRVLSRVYGAGVRLDRALRPRPRGRGTRPWVIGVGNLEAGGTGKTPFLAQAASVLAERGLEVAILTRGHGGRLGRRQPELASRDNLAAAADETRWLVTTLGGRVPVLVARDKAAGLRLLARRDALDLVLVDDAFQTHGLAVDRHVVLLDWEAPFGNGWLLPAGRLREPKTALARADALLLTRARDRVPPRLPDAARDRPVFMAAEADAGLRTLSGATFDAESLRGGGVALLCGLGRPHAFERLAASVARRHGFAVRRRVRVGDHAPIERELERLGGKLTALGCSHIVTTAKDASRLQTERNEPLLVLEQRLVIPELASLLETLGAHSSSAKSAKFTDSET